MVVPLRRLPSSLPRPARAALHHLRRRRIVAAALGTGAAWPVRGQTPWPDHPLRAIVPFPGGGGTLDSVARLLAPALGEELGQVVMVDNRGGAGGNLGIEAAVRAEPNGLTFLVTSMALAAFGHHLYPNLGWQPDDLTSVGLIGRAPLGLFVPASGPADFASLVAAARTRPGALNYGSGGNSTPSYVGMELLLRQLGLVVTNVPYRGSPPVITDMLGGRIDIALDSPPAWIGHVREGRMRMLFVTSRERWAGAPDVPTAVEAGVPGFVVEVWQGLQVPARTPRERVERLNRALRAVLQRPAIVERLTLLGIDGWPSSPEEMDRLVTVERARWGEVIRAAGIRPD